jgi:hypothetical protein
MVLLTAELQAEARAKGSRKLSSEQMAFAEPAAAPPMVLVAGAGAGKTECLIARFEWHLREAPIGARLQIISFSNSAANTFQTRFQDSWGPRSFKVARTLHSWTKSDLLLPHWGLEERVSFILPQAASFLADWNGASSFAQNLYLLVDEAQDCDDHQWRLFALLRDLGAKVALAGDPRQAIYGFQGARPMGILEFYKDEQPARLTINRRSSKTIVALANIIVSCSIPQCSVTGLESERAHPQVPALECPPGPLVSVHHVQSLQYHHLAAPLAAVLELPRPLPACVLTWMNADVDKLHQNLSLLGYQTLAILGPEGYDEDIAFSRTLSPEHGHSALVHIRSVHNCKGEGYDTIVFHIRGFASEEEALDDFSRRTPEDRQEELRRYYVACTRAKRQLGVLVQGAVAPLWWAAIAAAGQDLMRLGAPCRKTLSSRAEAAPADLGISVQKLRASYLAADCLLTHLHRAQTRAARTDQGEPQRGGLFADRLERLQGARAAPPPSARLVAVRASFIHSTVMQFVFKFAFARQQTLEQVRDALDILSLAPLQPQSLSSLERLSAADASFCQVLAAQLAEFLTDPTSMTLAGLQNAVAPAFHKLSGERGPLPCYSVVTCDVFKNLIVPQDNEPFLLGPPSSSAVRLVASALRQRASEPTRVTRMFRKRITMLDAKSLVECRSYLIEQSTRLLDGRVGAATVGAAALLCEFTRQHREVISASRALPYVSSAERGELSLSVCEDCVLGATAYEHCISQVEALEARLQDWHTEQELRCCAANLPVRAAPEDAPGVLTGSIQLFIPSHSGALTTSVFIAAKTQISLDDEVEALTTAGIQASAAAHRVVILETGTASVYIYEMKEGEDAVYAASRKWSSAAALTAAQTPEA